MTHLHRLSRRSAKEAGLTGPDPLCRFIEVTTTLNEATWALHEIVSRQLATSRSGARWIFVSGLSLGFALGIIAKWLAG